MLAVGPTPVHVQHVYGSVGWGVWMRPPQGWGTTFVMVQFEIEKAVTGL